MREPVKHWSAIGVEPEPKASIESGDLQAALSGFATRYLLDDRIFPPPHADDFIIGFGAVLWMMGDRHGAAAVWSRVCEEAFKGRYQYSSMGNFQSGLLLWIASVWLKDEDWHDDAVALLDKLLRRKRVVMGASFPSLLARLLRKEIYLPQVLAACNGEEAYERMALFYAGVRAFEAGDRSETRKLWMQVKAPSYSQCELEYYLLAHERKNL